MRIEQETAGRLATGETTAEALGLGRGDWCQFTYAKPGALPEERSGVVDRVAGWGVVLIDDARGAPRAFRWDRIVGGSDGWDTLEGAWAQWSQGRAG